MKVFQKQWFKLVLVLAVVSALCLTLNRFDNKYAQDGNQALDGLLILSAQELDAHGIHFLTHGWAFYPDILLTPEDLQAPSSNHYMFYTSIGENTQFIHVDEKSPHGKGTYCMTLYLPEEESPYALYLPEIYSSYRLYVNDRLLLQTGNPETKAYQPQTKNQIAVFEGCGTTTIMLAVSNYSHFYSGMVYPPAFGEPDSIHLMWGLQIARSACLLVLGTLVTFLAGYFALRMKQKKAAFFSLLSLTGTLSTAYPLLHSTFALPIFPWYALELTCIYVVYLLIILLQNRLCKVEKPIRRWTEGIAAGICVIAFCYGMSSSHVTVTQVELFSTMIYLYKIGTALYLLVISFSSLRQQIQHTAPLFFGSVAYCGFLIWDRLLPSYEPILTGWFLEWGTLLMITIVGYVLWRDMVAVYAQTLKLLEEQRHTKRQLSVQKKYMQQIEAHDAAVRKMEHDFRHHLKAMQMMAEQISSLPETEDQKLALLQYIDGFSQTMTLHSGRDSLKPLCNLASVDALLQYFHAVASQKGIQTSLTLTIPDNLPLSEVEWCAILGNLLENALESLMHTDITGSTIRISTKWTGKTFFLLVENTFHGTLRQKGGKYLSNKRPKGFGLGLESVGEIVERHDGTLQIYPTEEYFRVGIVLSK